MTEQPLTTPYRLQRRSTEASLAYAEGYAAGVEACRQRVDGAMDEVRKLAAMLSRAEVEKS